MKAGPGPATSDHPMPAISRAREAAIEPSLAITDPHIHLWDSFQPHYLLDDLLIDTASGHRIENTVYVECGWNWADSSVAGRFAPVAEVHAVARLAEQSRRRGGAKISAIVGHADFRYGDRVAEVLDQLIDAGHGILAGVRQCANWDADPSIPTHPTLPGQRLLAQPEFRQGFRHLSGGTLT